MNVDFEQLKLFVREALGVDGPGGSMAPSAPRGVPHRMPAADPPKETGDPQANKMYGVALDAREATEALVVALDDPIFDAAYEHAFKASAALRHVLNSLISSGAQPEPQERVVAPPHDRQPFGTFNLGQPSLGYGDGGVLGGELEEIVGSPGEDLDMYTPELQSAIDAYERLAEEDVKLFNAYFAGDKTTDAEGAI